MGTTQQQLHLRAREVAREWLAGACGDGILRDGGPERTCRGHSQLAGRPTRRRPCCPSAGEVRPECGVEQRADRAGGGEGARAAGERRVGGRLERGRSDQMHARLVVCSERPVSSPLRGPASGRLRRNSERAS